MDKEKGLLGVSRSCPSDSTVCFGSVEEIDAHLCQYLPLAATLKQARKLEFSRTAAETCPSRR